MNRKVLWLLSFAFSIPFFSPAQTFADKHVRYEPVKLSAQDVQLLRESLEKLHDRYDPKVQMLTRTLTDWNYHTDAQSGTFHEVRSSFNYAVGLLDLNDKAFEKRAFDLISKTITLQDTVSSSKTCGVWPYYLEEPLATKKSPADWNWADFNAVSLLDVYMGHQAKLSADLKAQIKRALIYAARSVQKRDVQPGYTNIAIMGTYVTFMVSHLFDLPDMKIYSKNRLQNFYNYTLEKGFTEYNSPTYTIVALDELDRMKRHIVDTEAKSKVDDLYERAWEVIATHFHQPSGQWAGPHSRSYSSLLATSIKGLLGQASGGKINLPGATPRSDVKIKHKIPEKLLPYFLSPSLPRVQVDQLTTNEPKVFGTTYLSSKYALSTANRSSLWNQRRPFLAYWGTPDQPFYLQVRLLHDLYDFSSSAFYSQQKQNSVLAAINFMTNGGDKHINIDRIKDGKFRAKDLRLRFEFGNVPIESLTVPAAVNDPFRLTVGDLAFDIELFEATFGDLKGHWAKGGDSKAAWLDYVIYSGTEKDFDLTSVSEAILAFAFRLQESAGATKTPRVSSGKSGGMLKAEWQGLSQSTPVTPAPQPGNL